MTRKSFLQTAATGLLAPQTGVRAAAAGPGSLRIPKRGVIPAALTPFTSDGQIARQDLRRHHEALSAVAGVTAIMVNGAAGEDFSLSRDERRSVVAEAVAAVGDRTPILAALRETRDGHSLADLARDAAAEGAAAVLVMPPARKDDFAADAAKARIAPVFDAVDVPVALYQTGYATETLVGLAGFSRLFAVKEGNGNPAAFERNLRALQAVRPDIAIWSTHSSWLLADLAVGADGILSGMGSVAADLQSQLATAVWHSDLESARRVNGRIFPLTQAFYAPGQNAHTRLKYALVRLGRWKNDFVRPPLKPLDAAEKARIDRALVLSGLLATG
ncbi:MAG: dihydrodipicolinate synthase family protein [Opitutaceae bacterium]|nr:dihydrodipicolinate synthase family protein [Opitutaceae bacterium]